jgi:drug/metabolite transporter (DMT)-like permease
MLRTGEPLIPSHRQWGPLLILGTILGANFAGTFFALQMGGTGKTAVLVYTMPIWVLLFARITLHERLTRLQLFAVSFALIGLVVLVEPWNLHGGVLASLFAVMAGMSWGASVVYVKHIQRRGGVSMVALSVWQMVVAAFVLGLGALAFEQERSVTWSGEFVAALVFTAFFATGLGWILFYYALRRMSAGMTGLGTFATPVIGVICAWIQLGEKPTPIEGIGMSLIGVGLALLAWSGLRSTGKR